MPVSLYFDYLSQPSRALLLFVRSAHINCNEVPINLLQAEHMTDEFGQVNRFKKCPAITHEDFHLSESVAILKYLCREFPISDYWYPSDSENRARVDEFLEWQHLGLRAYTSLYFLQKIIRPLMHGGAVLENKLKEAEKELSKALNTIENIWLKNSDFVGGNQISIADLLASQEIEQTGFAGFDIFKNRPKLQAYMNRVRHSLNPVYDEVLQETQKRVLVFTKDLSQKSKL